MTPAILQKLHTALAGLRALEAEVQVEKGRQFVAGGASLEVVNLAVDLERMQAKLGAYLPEERR